MSAEIPSRESVIFNAPLGGQLTARISADCGIYKPKIVTQFEFGI